MERKKKIAGYLAVLAVFAALMTIQYYEGVVNCLNTTVMAFSYKYGFISRGFMGTVLRLCNLITPGINLVSYQGIKYFSIFTDLVWLAVLFLFFYVCLKRIDGSYDKAALCLIILFLIFAVPEYLTVQNLGRSDACIAMISVIGALLIIKGKCEWLIIPLSGIAVCIHQGFVLMFFNVMLVLLFFQMIETEGKARIKNSLIFGGSIALSGGLFLYLNFFSHRNGEKIFQEIWDVAASLAYDGVVQYNVVYHEILGISPATDEWSDHVYNFHEFPVFVLLMLPYLVIAFVFFKNCIRRAEGIRKLKYLALAVGSATILPDIIVKIDYGRWMFSIIFYYFITVLALMAMGDTIVLAEMRVAGEKLKKHPALVVALLVYPMLFTPLRDTDISDLSSRITRAIFQIPARTY